MANAKSFFDVKQYHNDSQTVVDKWNVRELVEYERYCRDNLRFDDMKECYSDESRVRLSWYDCDGKAFVERSRSTGVGAKHKIFNAFVWLNGDRGISELSAMLQGPKQLFDGIECNHTSYARLLYRVEKEDSGWKIKGFDCIYERDTLIPVIPTKNFEIDPSKINKYRESYKCLSYALELQGLPCNQELPGEDRLETITALYEEASLWLFAK